jgi:tubulin monoglycylase TTLL3/8
MLVNIQRAQVGSNDYEQICPNLNSMAKLNSKLSQMNKIEEQNSLNQKISNKKMIYSHRVKCTKKPKNIIKNGAKFNDYIDHVSNILEELKKKLPQYKLNGSHNIWILKPSNLSRGRGVTCVDSLEPIEQSLMGTNDTGVVVQKYIENPLIIYNRKFDIRQWVLVTSLSPLVIWMWKEPYIRFGAEDYALEDINNIYSHLTNNSISKHSQKYKNDTKFNEDMWTCHQFSQYIGEEKYAQIFEKMKNAIICSFYAAHHEIKKRENSHELFGYDFMIDEDMNVFLIEVNASPALDYSTKITENAVKTMVKDLIEIIIDHDNGKNLMDYNSLEGNKFIQIFNEKKGDFIKIPSNVPNKSLFY